MASNTAVPVALTLSCALTLTALDGDVKVPLTLSVDTVPETLDVFTTEISVLELSYQFI
jgi:hypothetical protein